MPGFIIVGDELESQRANQAFRRANWWIVEELGPIAIPVPGEIIAKTLTLPGYSTDEQIITGASIKYKFAHIINWDDVTVTFYDTREIFNEIIKWRNLVHKSSDKGPATGISPADSYKARSKMSLVDPDGIPEFQFTLFNSWPKSVSHSELSYESSEVKIVSLVLSYDWANEKDKPGGR